MPVFNILLAGESNMAGRGGVHGGLWDGVVPAQCAPHQSIPRLSPTGQWEVAHEPVHAGIDFPVCGVGPGMPFARALLQHLQQQGAPGAEITIRLVPCAVAGTPIWQWGQGGWQYRRMIGRAQAAAAGPGDVVVMLWYGGESDAHVDGDAAAYRGRFEELVANVRADLRMPELPFIQVALASEHMNFGVVRNGQWNVNLPNVRTVDALGLALNQDNLHLSTESQVVLGERLAEAYIQNFLQ